LTFTALTQDLGNRRYLKRRPNNYQEIDYISILRKRAIKLIVKFFAEKSDVGLMNDQELNGNCDERKTFIIPAG